MIIKWRKVLKKWIPGIISGGADNDPAGISTYSVSGAQFGYQQLWLLVLSTPMLIAIQAMSARLGDVKRKGLMSIIREHFSPTVAIVASIIIIITNVATLGADLAGVSDTLGMITGTPYLLWVGPLVLLIWYIETFKNYHTIEKYLSFLTLIFLAYVISAFIAKPDWLVVLKSVFIPTFAFSGGYFIAALGLLGTTITPFLFFWQSRQEMEEHHTSKELVVEAHEEDQLVAPGFIYSNIISLFIIVSTAAVLNLHGITQIVSASDAARALEPLAGHFAGLLFAVGIVGSGLLAIPVLVASTGYVVAETFGWRESLTGNYHREKGFYFVMTATLLIGMTIVLTGVNPIKALLYSQVLNGILVPFLVSLIMIMCNDKKIMGNLVNGWFDNLFGAITILILILGSTGLFWQLITHGI
jgi:NRAMP (natural resistance-associated macrophage protein)-like metal ion transporter